MTSYELVVAASLLDFRNGDVDAAKAMVVVFKERYPEIWEACLEHMNPRHVGSLILDVVLRPSRCTIA